jgi:hypothetical protein
MIHYLTEQNLNTFYKKLVNPNAEGIKRLFSCEYSQKCISKANQKEFKWDRLSEKFLHNHVCDTCEYFKEQPQ